MTAPARTLSAGLRRGASPRRLRAREPRAERSRCARFTAALPLGKEPRGSAPAPPLRSRGPPLRRQSRGRRGVVRGFPPETAEARRCTSRCTPPSSCWLLSALLPAQTNWTEAKPVAGQASPAMAYDSARGRTVLFGGNSGSAIFAETWEWDG